MKLGFMIMIMIMITRIVYDSSLLELLTTGVSLNLMKIPVERIVITSPDYKLIIVIIIDIS